mmetsp:Transcript_4176/g.5928  ORF Transcript_4176/g.5928 Transcript_4176/m.5928 type:complete len:115 (-) Transcript_4176:547-891(-)
MHVTNSFVICSYGVCHIIFLDVHVVGIGVDDQAVLADLVDEAATVLDSVEEVGLEPVGVFDPQFDSQARCALGEGFEDRYAVRDAFFGGRAGILGEGGIYDASEELAPKRFGVR